MTPVEHSWDRLINAPDYYERPTPLELALRDALKDAAQQLEQAEQRELKRLQAWVDAEKFDRQFGLRLPGDSALAVVLNEADETLAALTPDEGTDPGGRLRRFASYWRDLLLPHSFDYAPSLCDELVQDDPRIHMNDITRDGEPIPVTAEQPLKPYRATMYFVFAAEDIEEAGILYGSIEDWAERGGAIVQGGSVSEMDAADVVPDSELAQALAALHTQASDEGAE